MRRNSPDFLMNGANLIEKLGHALHMQEMWMEAAKIVKMLKKEEVTSVPLATCRIKTIEKTQFVTRQLVSCQCCHYFAKHIGVQDVSNHFVPESIILSFSAKRTKIVSVKGNFSRLALGSNKSGNQFMIFILYHLDYKVCCKNLYFISLMALIHYQGLKRRKS